YREIPGQRTMTSMLTTIALVAIGALSATPVTPSAAVSTQSLDSTPPSARRVGVRIDDVMIPMRDGTKLSADIYLPADTGRYPVLVTRSPYPTIGGKAAFRATPSRAEIFVRQGFAVVVQDTRGRGDSQGRFGYHFQEGPDG